MANPNAPFGARVNQEFYSGSAPKTELYVVPASDGTAIYIGDIVQLVGTMAADENGVYRPVIKQSTTSGAVLGVVMSVVAITESSTKHREVSTLRTIEVCDDPMVIFEMQTKGTFTVADCGLNANLSTTTAGSAYTSVSGMTLDGATILGTSTLQIKILGVSSAPRNEIGAYTVLKCKFNDHVFSNGVTGV